MQTGVSTTLLASALLLGGGQGWLGDTACQLLALAAIGLAAWRHLHDPGARWPRVAWLAALPLLVPLLQLLPLPDVLWAGPDARAALAQDLAVAGVDAPSRMTLQPLATERALWWLLPAIALYLGGLQLGDRARRTLLAAVVAIALASVLLGLAQLAGGVDSALRFYRITNENEAVGFFANRNHYASLLAVALPLVIVGTGAWYRRRDDFGARTMAGVAAGVLMVALLILGLGMSGSRAGLLLGMLAVLLSLPIALTLRERRRGARRWLVAAVAVALVLIVQVALLGVLQRTDTDPLADSRMRYAAVTTAAAADHAPLGTGLGGFRAAFETGDPLPDGRTYINHAHDDYLELWLEAGWLAVPVVGLLAAAFVAAGVRAWRRLAHAHADGRESSAVRAAVWVSLLLLALHSIVDYPLRTTALSAVAGLLAALLARPPSKGSSSA